MALGQDRQPTDKQVATSPSASREPSDIKRDQFPTISLPKGGGAIHGIGEKFAANPVTGTGSMTVPIATSPGRSGFGPQLALSYDSGAGNGPFGFGWHLSLPSITRKTDKGLPQYWDSAESDVYILSGAEDLVPVLNTDGTRFKDDQTAAGYTIYRYRPRIEGLFARIERWLNDTTGEVHWRSISRDNITTLYGKTAESRIADPDEPGHVFTWLICESYDDKGNVMVYTYAAENDENIDHTQANERNRVRTAQRYIKRIKYGNQVSRLIQPDLTVAQWLFEVVFDYDEGHYEVLNLDSTRPEADQHRFIRASALPELPWAAQERHWPIRPDPFSSYRSGFELRTYRRCRRILMFHRFAELGSEPYLTRSTEFDYADLDYSHATTIEDELTYQGSTRFASFIRAVTQSGFVRDDTQAALVHNSVTYVTYLKKSMPPLEFEYSKAHIQDDIHDVSSASLENLPVGLDNTRYQWVDLDGEGVSGVLTEQANSWFYKRNLSPTNRVGSGADAHIEAQFAPLELVSPKPALALADHTQFLDLVGDGHPDVVQFAGSTPGFYERTMDEQWDEFVPFVSLPNVDWSDPNLKFIDLDGDGHADILISEHDAFRWYRSLGKDGFDAAQRTIQPWDEEQGPRIVFADGEQSIYLADMSGDGLTDIVRIRNGEVCYWPNQGYGHFGAMVTMDNAPWFDSFDQFDQRRIRLADIDGSGTIDIIYLGREEVRLYFNQSGNRLSDPRPLRQFPPVDNLDAVTTVDLLGNGTACLVWSSPLPTQAPPCMRYIDLMGGQKPHLLISSVNNLGAETRVQYVSSTKFYLADKLKGQPWVTKLPFPVHVVERVETFDTISRNHFVTSYAYHHGYFDGVEHEFRGFGMVEQQDTEAFAALSATGTPPDATNTDEAFHVPPVLTRTWFHTGAFVDESRISQQFAHEYYREGDTSEGLQGLTNEQLAALLLDDTVLPSELRQANGTRLPYTLTTEEVLEACRALKGAILRQEIYALDDTDEADRPYSVSERNYTIELLQLRNGNKHAVFFTHPREQIDFHYERKLVQVNGQKLADPRVNHTMTLEVDPFGNILRSVAIGYRRRDLPGVDAPEQKQTHLTFTVNRFFNHATDTDWYRLGVPIETRTYEIVKPPEPGITERRIDLLRFERLNELTQMLFPLSLGEPDTQKLWPYEQWDWHLNPAHAPLDTRLRLLEHTRALYRKDDLSAPLPLGEAGSLALPFESYKLAFTPALAGSIFVDSGKLTTTMLNSVLADEGKYVHSDGDTNWWTPSGRSFYSPNSADLPAQELAYARQHFFLPHRHRNPFHTDVVSTESFVTYDTYDLLMVETRDALGNRFTVGERSTDPTQPLVRLGQDYRVLQPALIMDPNRNRTAVTFDALGMVVGTAVMGKPEDNPRRGDLLDGFDPNLTDAVLIAHLQDPQANPYSILKQATTRLIYDLFAYYRTKGQANPQPAVVYLLARETHDADLAPGQQTKIQHSFSYSDGFGREMQKKIQAEAGPVPRRDPTTSQIIVGANGQPEMTQNDISPRWVGSGWTVFNNKGKPVRQYEPFFTDTHHFEFDVRIGVSPVLFYDPVERVVATLHPNHTYEKIVFDPWRQETWDVNDTIKLDPRTDPDISGYVAPYFKQVAPQPNDWQTWLQQRGVDPLAPPPDTPALAPEKKAAVRTLPHGDTPTIAHFDTLGRSFLTLAHNGFKPDKTPIQFPTRIRLDIEGNQREVIDAQDRIVMHYDYDILSNRIHRASMEAGERWMLNDVMGKPLYAWDSRGHQFRAAYDRLRRPTDAYLREGADPELRVGRTLYGEIRPNPETSNSRGKVVRILDQAGLVSTDEYDFKGNLLLSQRQLAQEYKTTLNWLVTVPLEEATYTSLTRYDALNRPIEQTAPDSSIIHNLYNEANLLERVEVNLRGAAVTTPFVTNIDYNAKGQRTRIDYSTRDGKGISTTYTYDPDTFRLVHLKTSRNATAFDGTDRPGEVQNLHYTYDPVGNITSIRDDAQQTIYFRNRIVEPSNGYTYDALYRLIEATGREHLGQTNGQPNPPTPSDAFNLFHTRLDHPGNGDALGTYTESYLYDAVGNILTMQHRGNDPLNAGWTRTYTYNESSQLELGKVNNRLTSTTLGATSEVYRYDGSAGLHGNITAMPHLPLMQWDYRDQLQATSQQVANNGNVPEITYYVYGTSWQRVRKVTERQANVGQTPTRMKERIYLGGFEIYREYSGEGHTITLERETLHIMDDKQRIALIETRTQGEDQAPTQLIRYQFSNHLGSATLELDDQAQIISYEEYYPYGSTSYQAVRNKTETPKRYRYTGKERDEESGLYYHGARYYACWLGRWVSCDPAGLVDGTNLFRFCFDNPLKIVDSNGMQGQISKAGAPVGSPLINAPELGMEIKASRSTNQVVGKINDVEEPSLGGEIHANPPDQANPDESGPTNVDIQAQQTKTNPEPAAGNERESEEGLQQGLPSDTQAGENSGNSKQFTSSQISAATSENSAKEIAAVDDVKNANPKTDASAANASARPSKAGKAQEGQSFSSKILGLLNKTVGLPLEKLPKLPQLEGTTRWGIFSAALAGLLGLAILIAKGVGSVMVKGTVGNVIRIYSLAIFLAYATPRFLLDIAFPKLNKKFNWNLPENPATGRDKPPFDRWSWVHHTAGWVFGFFGVSFWLVLPATIVWEVFEWSGPSGLGDEESSGNRVIDLAAAWLGWALARVFLH